MKLAVNTVIFGLNGAVAEGLVLAERSGIARALAYEVIAACAAGAPYVGYKRAAFLDPEATPVAFALDLAAKDLGLITELARPARASPMPQAPSTSRHPGGLGRRGGRDFSTRRRGTCGRRAADDRPPMRRRHHLSRRRRPSQPPPTRSDHTRRRGNDR